MATVGHFPCTLLGATLAAVIQAANRWMGWQTTLLVWPVLYFIHNFHQLNIDKLEEAARESERERQHASEKAAIHLRTVEALAMAIEAKDGTTHDHLQRVQVYALAVGRELGLSDGEIEALRAASILHDIGKLAVPEYIISKPGKLSPSEFEKMKIHPVVGAQILETVSFPYPVSPIVRHHHEKWDGSGYPDGLAGEQIPIGARILSAVDCLDALASDRQYRRALPLPEAIAVVVSEAGKSFDPRIVEILERRYVELEKTARHSQDDGRPKLQTDIRIERGAAPAAGFADESEVREDVVRLHEKISSYSNSTVFEEFAHHAGVGIGFDAMAVLLDHDETLVPVFVLGLASEALAALRIPVGQGLAGWVAENHKPIMNGNPAVEPGFPQHGEAAQLRNALAVLVEPEHGPMGVVCLYRAGAPFTVEHQRILEALSAGLIDGSGTFCPGSSARRDVLSPSSKTHDAG